MLAHYSAVAADYLRNVIINIAVAISNTVQSILMSQSKKKLVIVLHETNTIKFLSWEVRPLAIEFRGAECWTCIQQGLKQQMRTSELAEPVYIIPLRAYSAEFSLFFRRLTDFLKFGDVFGDRIGLFSADFRRRVKIRRIRISGSG